MLQAVGHPVAVNPDAKLARHARAHGWPMVNFSQRTKSVIRRVRHRRRRRPPSPAPASPPAPATPAADDRQHRSRSGYRSHVRPTSGPEAARRGSGPGFEGELAGLGDEGAGGVPDLAVLLEHAALDEAGAEHAAQRTGRRARRARAPSARRSAPSRRHAGLNTAGAIASATNSRAISSIGVSRGEARTTRPSRPVPTASPSTEPDVSRAQPHGQPVASAHRGTVPASPSAIPMHSSYGGRSGGPPSRWRIPRSAGSRTCPSTWISSVPSCTSAAVHVANRRPSRTVVTITSHGPGRRRREVVGRDA